MPLIFILLLLAPLLDIYLLLRWLFESPVAAALYWAAATAAGALLIKFAKIGLGETLELLRHGRGAAAVGGFAAAGFAGALLIFPGYLSDILAAIVLAAPFVVARRKQKTETRPLEVEAEIVGTDERED